MGKKNSSNGPGASTSSRGHKHPRGSGRPPGRGFTGHKGRGRDYARGEASDIPGVADRPESAVDDPEDDGSGSEETSGEGVCSVPLSTSSSGIGV